MRNSSDRPRRMRAEHYVLVLCAAFLLLFVLTGVFVANRVATIADETADITKNAAPSIRQLAALRVDVQELVFDLDDAIANADRGVRVDRPRLERLAVDLAIDARGYRSLPMFPGENALWVPAQRDLDAIATVAEHEIDALDRMDLREARGRDTVLHGMVSTAEAKLQRLIEVNANAALRLGASITNKRHSAERALSVVAVLAGLLAIAAGFAGLRAVRDYDETAEMLRAAAEEKAAELDDVATRLAHDIRGPLATLSMAVALTRSKGADGAHLDRAQRAIDRIDLTVDSVLSFARAGAHPTPGSRADLQVVFEQLRAELEPEARDAGVTLRFEPAEPAVVACDAGLLAIAVSNLVRNALKFMSDDGPREVTVRALPPGEFERIEVEDTGPGVPAGLGAGLFQPYVRGPGVTKPGIGLGLAIVKRICERHGGTVGVV